MTHRNAWIRSIPFALALFACAACSTPPVTHDAQGFDGDATASDGASDATGDAVDRTIGDAVSTCRTDPDCSDSVFCNGVERCMVGAAGADARGCVAASPASPCTATQTCNETTMRCDTGCAGSAGDADGDGHRSIACGGDDCDDSDANRFPGNPEVCVFDSTVATTMRVDPEHDEDCDGSTYANPTTHDGDHDGDGYVDRVCCNTDRSGGRRCGDDCHDTAPVMASPPFTNSVDPQNVHPTQSEACNGVDENCNGMVDESLTVATYSPDCDGDGYGDLLDAGTMGCGAAQFPPCMGHPAVPNHTDCDDMLATVHPTTAEVCDAAGLDENCNGTVNEGCGCTGTAMRACPGAVGVCAAGTQTCSSGVWGMCSVSGTAEVCNTLDDDCDGVVDDGVTVNCWVDSDNDTYAPMSATASPRCPDSTRPSHLNCPDGFTGRAPVDIGTIDCDDAAGTSRPGGTEVCDARDNDCDGAIDDGVGSTYYRDADGDGFGNPASPMAACALPGGYSVQAMDCNDANNAIHPGALEVCDCADNNCNGTTDEALTSTRYRDADGDGHGIAGMPVTVCTSTSMLCSGASPGPIAGAGDDCDDANLNAFPGQTMYFTTPRASGTYDYDCDGTDTPYWAWVSACSAGPAYRCASVLVWSRGSTAPCGSSEGAIPCLQTSMGLCYSNTFTPSTFRQSCR